MSTGQIVLIVLFGGAGSFMLVTGINSLIKTRRFVATAKTTTGRIVAYRREDSIDTDDKGHSVTTTVYFPMVEFKDSQGREQRVELTTSGSPEKYPVGAAVPLLYDENNPSQASMQSFVDVWGLTVLLLAGAAIFLPIAISVWIFDMAVKMNS